MELHDLAARWQRGWAVSRGLPPTESVDGGLRVRCLQMGRDVEYVALDLARIPSLAELVRQEKEITWLTVPAADPDAAAEALTGAGLNVLKSSEKVMVTDLRTHPVAAVDPPYRLETTVHGGVVTVRVLDAGGEEGAHGYLGRTGTDGVADRILTAPGHRRRGLARAVMSALARAAVADGAVHGILVASDEGQPLYAALGWEPVATVLIASTPGVEYPA